MTELEHHDEAMRLLLKADNAPVDDEIAAWYQRQAQTQATLAVADRLGQLVDMLTAWRADVESVPITKLVDVATARAIIRGERKAARR